MHSKHPPAQTRLTPTHLGVTALMFTLSVMSYFDRTIMSIAGPNIIKEFQLSETQMGLVYSAFILGYSLMMIPGGRWADRFGPRRVLTGMALGSALFTALTALAGWIALATLMGIVPVFVVIRICFGFVTAPLYPACGRMNVAWMPLMHRARVLSIVICGAGFGGAVSPVLFTWMIASFGWRWSFVLASLATVLVDAIWFFYVRDDPSQHPQLAAAATCDTPPLAPVPASQPVRWGLLLRDRNLIALTAGYFALGYFEYIFFYWIFYYLGEIRGLGAEESAVYSTGLFLTFTIMMALGGWLCDHFAARYGRSRGLRRVAMTGLAASALLMYAGAGSTATLPAVTLMSLAFGCSAIADVAFWTATIDIAGKEAGSACGVLNMGGNVGGLLAPTLTPIIASYFGWTWGLYFGSVMALAALVVWLFIDTSSPITPARGEAAESSGP